MTNLEARKLQASAIREIGLTSIGIHSQLITGPKIRGHVTVTWGEHFYKCPDRASHLFFGDMPGGTIVLRHNNHWHLNLPI
jgi:hypothetical protein